MDGVLGTDLPDTEALQAAVLADLVALRGQTGRLTAQKFGHYETLRVICGGGDLLDAFFMFEREMKRFIASAGRDEAAAALSMTAPAETVLERLDLVAQALPQGGITRDQRTARRWSDAGLAVIASDLVYMAEVQGRLGRELLRIEIAGNEQHGLLLTIDQMTTAGLDVRSPLIRAWRYRDGEPVEQQLRLDPDGLESATATNDAYIMTRYRLQLELPSGHVPERDGDAVLTVSVEGRDAPMRTVTFADKTTLPEGHAIETTAYRTIASISLTIG